MKELIVWLDKSSNYPADLIGNKAYNLQKLNNNKFNVPKTFCLTTKIDNLTPELWLLVEENYNKLVENSIDKKIALRSSTLLEDSANASYAGIFESFLNISSFEELRSKVSYLLEKFKKNERSTALIAQEMIPANYAGVVFSMNPLTGKKEILIEATKGLADKLLSGKVNPLMAKIIGNKILENKTGIAKVSLKKLAKRAKKIEKIFGKPQDIEWVIYQNKIYFLQTRPMTALNEIFWSREPIDERFPNVVKPLDWTYQVDWGLDNSFANLLKYLGIIDISLPIFKIKKGLLHVNLADLEKLPVANAREVVQENEETIVFSKSIRSLAFILKIISIALRRPKQWQKDLASYFRQLPTGVEDPVSRFKKLKQASLVLCQGHFRTLILVKVTYNFLKQLRWDERQSLVIKQKNKNIETREDLVTLKKQFETNSKIKKLLINNRDSKTILNQIKKDNLCKDALSQFINKYGHRTNFYELSLPRWAEEPAFIIDGLKSLSLLKTSKSKLSEKQPLLVNFLTKLFYRFVDIREDENFYIMEIGYRLKKLILSQAKDWQKQELIRNSEDVFFLTIQEIEKIFTGKKHKQNLKSLIKKRKEVFKHNIQLEKNQVVPFKKAIKGVPVSKGRVSGKAVILNGMFRKAGHQDIIVSKSLNSSMIGFLSDAQGIITECGGKLSHGAILCREMSIPAVSMVKGATSLIRDGQKLLLDAEQGKIFILQ